MAYTVFYIQTGGSNSNAGSTNNTTPIWSNASVNWTGGTGGGGNNQFVVTDATASAITAGVDWINLGGSYIAQVSSVSNVGSVYTVVLNTTTAYGTEPATNAAIAAKDGGCWASLAQGALTTAGTAQQSTQICIQAGTYTASGAVTIALTGSATAPVWWRGYNTTIGDLEPGNVNWAIGNNSSSGLSYPTITMAGNTLTLESGSSLWSGVSFTCSRSGAAVSMSTNSYQTFWRCRFVSTGTGTSAFALNAGTQNIFLLDCYFSSPATSNGIVDVTSGPVVISGCYFSGAGSGSTQVGAVLGNLTTTISGCNFYKCGTFGVTLSTTTQNVSVNGCTFYSCGSDSIRVSATITSGNVLVVNNNFFSSGGYDINNTSGTNTDRISLASNLSYNPTSGHLNGFGDWAELNPLVDLVQSYVSSTNLALVSGSNGANAGLPQQWENLTAGLGGFSDTGAWDRSSKGGGGNVGSPVIMTGGKM